MNQSKRKWALQAGVSLLIMAVAAGYAFGYVFNTLNEAGNAEESLEIYKSIESAFLTGIVCWLVVLVTDLVVANALYHFFKPVSAVQSKWTAIIRVVYTIFLGAALVPWIGIFFKMSNGDGTVEQQGLLIQNSLLAFAQIWSIGLIGFGFHLIGLGLLVIKAKYIHKFMGYLLLVAGISYSLIHAAKQMPLENTSWLELTEMVMSLPMAIAEIWLAIWLIIKGGKEVEKGQFQQTVVSA